MRKNILLAFFCSVSMASFAQQKKIDSLINELNNHTQQDTTRYFILKNIARTYNNTDPQKALQTADEAIALAKKLNDNIKVASALTTKGISYHKLGKDSLAFAVSNQALDIYIKAGDRQRAADLLFNMGYIYFDIANYYEALKSHEAALKLYEQLNSLQEQADVLNSIGNSYLRLGVYAASLESYFKALKIYGQIHPDESNSMVVTNIGNVYYHLSDYPKSLQYHLQAVKADELTGNKENLAHDYDNLGNTYDEMKNLDKALEYYQKALSLYKVSTDQRNMAATLMNSAVIYRKMKQYDTALNYLQQALKICESYTDEYKMSAILDGISSLFMQAPDAFLLSHRIAPANRNATVNKYLEQSIKLAGKTGSLTKQAATLELMSEAFEQQGNFTRALATYKQSVAFSDSALNDETKQKATRQEMQYEFDKKEALTKAETDRKQIMAAAEIKQQQTVKNATITGAVLLLIAAISVFGFYKRKRDAEQQQKEAEFKTEVTDTEMKALRSQMNPHFIFNSLNSISDYVSKNDIKSADYYLTRFAKLMRMILENSEQKEVSLDNDLKALEIYMQLESMRMKNKFSYQIIVEEGIDPENTMIPPLMLQPFVENSIWHGISKKEGQGKILIHIKKEGDLLNCIVEDNGIGRERSRNTEKPNLERKSLGMKITKARIDIINKIKKSKAAIELSDLAEGLRVEVKIPLELSF